MGRIQKRTEDGDRLQSYPKGHYELMTAGDPTTAILDMAITSLSGRKAVYPNTEEGLELFKQKTTGYFEHLKRVNEENDTGQMLLPDLEGLAVWLGITRQTLWTYGRTRTADWKEYLQLVKTAILAARKDAATRFKTPPMVFIFDAVNNYDYFNTSEIKLTTDPKQEEQQKIEDQIDEAGLKWNGTEYVLEDDGDNEDVDG